MVFDGIPYIVFQKDGDVSRDITQRLDASAKGPIDQLTALFQSTLGIDIAEDRRVHIDMEKNGRIRITGYSRDGMEGSIVLKQQGAAWIFKAPGVDGDEVRAAADALVTKVQAIAQPVLMPQAAAVEQALSLPQMLDEESAALHQLIQAYTSKIAKLKEQIEQYKKFASNSSANAEKLADLETEVADLKDKASLKKKEIAALQAKLDSAPSQEELDRLKAEIAKLKQQLESIDGLRAKLRAAKEVLTAEKALNKQLNEKIDSLKEEIDGLKKQLLELRTTRDKLQATISKLEETNKKLEEDQAASVKAACDVLRAQFASQFETLQKAHDELAFTCHATQEALRKKSQQLSVFCDDVRTLLHLGNKEDTPDEQILDRGAAKLQVVFADAQRTVDAEASNALLLRELSQAKQNQTRLIEMLQQKAPAAVDEACFILSQKRVFVFRKEIPDVKETLTVKAEILLKSLEDQSSPFELGPYQASFYNETFNPEEQQANGFLTLCLQSQKVLKQLKEVEEQIQQAGSDADTTRLVEEQEQLQKTYEELLEKFTTQLLELEGEIRIPLISISGQDVRLNPHLLEIALSFPQIPLVLVKGKRRFKVTREEEVSAAAPQPALMSAVLSVATAALSDETSPVEPEESAEEAEETASMPTFYPAVQVQNGVIDLESIQETVKSNKTLGFNIGADQFYFKDDDDILTDVEQQLHGLFALASAAESADQFAEKLETLDAIISMPIDTQDERIDKTALTHALDLLAGKMIESIQLVYGSRVWTISSSQSQQAEALV